MARSSCPFRNPKTQTTHMSKTKREVLPPIACTAGMEAMVAEITNLAIEHAGVSAELDRITAERERALADELRPLQLKAELVAKRAKARLARVEAFVADHRDELMPDKKKSFELPTAVVGFALSTKPKVVLANEGDDWSSVATRLEGLKWGEPFVREPAPEVDKDAILAARETLTEHQLKTAGLRIEQPEKFYVQPKSQVAETAKA